METFGLLVGEMDADELFESCLDPENRELVQVKLDEEGKLDEETLNLFFGGNADLRKRFINENL